jgi:hypothetical protein
VKSQAKSLWPILTFTLWNRCNTDGSGVRARHFPELSQLHLCESLSFFAAVFCFVFAEPKSGVEMCKITQAPALLPRPYVNDIQKDANAIALVEQLYPFPVIPEG